MKNSNSDGFGALRKRVLSLLSAAGPIEAAKKCKVQAYTLVTFAHGYSTPHKKTIDRLRKALA